MSPSAPEERGATASSEASAGIPVTVSITRLVALDRIPEVTRWVQAGVNLANRYPGFLGSGWVRGGADSVEWHMLYRFADPSTLAAWEGSAERAEWLKAGEGLVVESRVERRTGIEGWFDRPSADSSSPPARWKQAVTIWLGFTPVNLLFTLLTAYLVPGWNAIDLALRVLVTTTVLTPVMVFWVLPLVTRLLRPWLARG